MKHSDKTRAWSWLTCLVVFLSLGDARAADPRKSLDVPNYKLVDALLSTASHTTASCPNTGMVAFSVTGTGHVSQGGDTLLGYRNTYTNLGGGWVHGGGTFIAPCTGLYSFTISFVKDPYYYEGTSDDVYVHVAHNGIYKGNAWSGTTSALGRSTGTYTVALFMNAGDYLQTFAASQNGRKRHLGQFNLTGYMVKAAY
jgi:hypothetical protein